MEYKFSKKVTDLKASAIREIFKHTGKPGVISLAAGSPAAEAFPFEKFKALSENILEEQALEALSYNLTEGYTPLREKVKALLVSRGCFDEERDDLIITSGAQQGIELTSKVLCDFGDTMITESPSFIGSLNSFRSNGVKLVGVSLEEDGVNIEELEEVMKKGNAKIFYIIANFQNPTGRTTSYEKRKAVYELAKKYEVVILEDNPYGDLKFKGEDVPAIKSLDKDGLVVYAGTFSKILAPGLRVGYIAGPKEIIQKCVVCKQVEDVHTNIWAQLICNNFLEKYDMKSHLASIRPVYERKCSLMLDAMEKNFSDKLSWSKPEGGMFIWVSLPEGVDGDEFCKRAITEYKIAIVPGSAFAVNPDDRLSAFRLNFSTPADEDIVKGIEILGKMTKEI